jgi:hypothetical protein
MKDDPVYSPPDCFESYPFPDEFEKSLTVEMAGRIYNDHRAALMAARNEGMTKTYNRFHDRDEASEDIIHLRELHAEVDRAALRAYGWDASPTAPSPFSSASTTRMTTPTRAASSGPPPFATKSFPASSPSTQSAPPPNAPQVLRRLWHLMKSERMRKLERGFKGRLHPQGSASFGDAGRARRLPNCIGVGDAAIKVEGDSL